MDHQKHPLRRYREENELTQEALGERLGVTGMTIYRWENGSRLPQRSQWATITARTGINPVQFIPFVKTGAAA